MHFVKEQSVRKKSKKDFSYLLVMILKTEVVCQRCSSKKVFCKYAGNLLENTHAVVWFVKQLCWNHISGWVFFGKFGANLQSTFFEEHLWQTTSVFNIITNKYEKSFLLFRICMTRLAFTSSKSTIETQEQGEKSVQN